MNKLHRTIKFLSLIALVVLAGCASAKALELRAQNTPDSSHTTTSLTYPIVDTGQTACYSDSGNSAITCPDAGQALYGQDAQFDGNQPSYTLSADDLTVTDNVTGLTWTQSPDWNEDGSINTNDKMTFSEAQDYPDTLNAQNYGGYSDWRLPTIKELYSLINFSGQTGMSAAISVPYINTDYFAFAYGDEAAGERFIDAQYWSSTEYVSTTMGGSATTFGVNFADGRIKGYGREFPGGGEMAQYVRFVRGNTAYGVNDFTANGDGTITDAATGLMWSQDDSGVGMNWEDALAWVEQRNAENYLGHNDWRLPSAKELQSIVDYDRSPDTTNSAAIDPMFNITTITDEANATDYPYFWSNTTHLDGPNGWGVYVSFGEALGYMNNNWIDVHGAGAQRSDPKSGNPADYPTGHGPQGDAIRIYNYVRLVRDAETTIPSVQDEVYLPLILEDSSAAPTATPTSTPTTSDGYNLFTPLNDTNTYLTNKDGETVYTWTSSYRPGLSVYLLENGTLLRTGNTGPGSFNTGGAGGVVQEIAPDNTVVWQFEYADSQVRLHHDIEPLPNGNVLMIAWELKTEAEAISAGRNPSLLSEGELWPDHIIEVNPTSNAIVWEWHTWDHLIQDYDSTQANYGVVADHPELIDLNYAMNGRSDWNHINSIDYNAEYDQILLSVHNFSEIWIIDHSTTTAEAAGHSGGNSSKGGDLLYRWGNPQTYDAGSAADQQFFVQHDAEWIPTGYPGEGNILVFNNGTGRPGGNYSSVDEIVLPVDGLGNYTLSAGSAYGPTDPTWSYIAATPTDLYATNISGAQRLSNGNTLICDGPNGDFYEVTPQKEVVWSYDYSSSVFRVTRYAAGYPGLPN